MNILSPRRWVASAETNPSGIFQPGVLSNRNSLVALLPIFGNPFDL
jgi:hypothetical protein